MPRLQNSYLDNLERGLSDVYGDSSSMTSAMESCDVQKKKKMELTDMFAD